MKPYPSITDDEPKRVYDALQVISRIRKDDITDWNDLPNKYMLGRKVGKVPTSITDVAATDREGDFNYDATYYYLCINNGGTIEWQTIPFSSFSAFAKAYYGNMYAEDASITVTVSSAGVYYPITTGLSAGPCSGFTFQSASQLRCDVAGTYLVTFGAAITCGSANQSISVAVMVNTTAYGNIEGSTDLSAASKKFTVASCGILTLAKNDVVKLSVENETGTNNITLTHLGFTVTRLGP